MEENNFNEKQDGNFAANINEKLNIKGLICTREYVYFYLMLILSLLIYFLLLISVVGAFYIVFFAVFIFFMQGIAIGNIRQNCIKITAEHFEEIYSKISEYSSKLDLERVPDVYLMQSGGMLNAFATRFLCRDIVVIYSEILEMAYEKGEDALNFVIAHELAHVKRKHLSKMKYIACAQFIPFLGLAYSRACEITCDRIAFALGGKMSLDGLLVLAAGKKLYKKVNSYIFVKNAMEEKGFWGWLAEICSTHPPLSKRIMEISRTL